MHDRTFLRTTAVVSALVVIVAISTSVSARSSSASDELPRPPAELPASLGPATVDPLVETRLELEGSVDVLVTLDGRAALASARGDASGDSRALLRATVPAYRTLKAELRDDLPRLTVLRDYRTLPILFVRIRSEAQLDRLRAAPTVVAVGADRRDRITLDQSLPLIGQPAAAGSGHTGQGVVVAVLDTGVDYARSAFGTCGGGPGSPGCRVLFAQDFAPEDGQLDANGHGSNVGGIVAGVAPGAGLLALDVFDGNSAFTSDQVEALNFAIANQAAYNVRAINMSLGNSTRNTSPCSDPSDARVAAFANARAAGILPVVSSGNARYSNGSPQVGISRPACIPGALPAGAVYDANVGSQTYSSAGCSDATTQADQITCFSQVWTGAMVLAPGARITAAGTTYSGTSMAAPHVAGAVAVLHDAAGVASDEALAAPTPSQVESALLNSGRASSTGSSARASVVWTSRPRSPRWAAPRHRPPAPRPPRRPRRLRARPHPPCRRPPPPRPSRPPPPARPPPRSRRRPGPSPPPRRRAPRRHLRPRARSPVPAAATSSGAPRATTSSVVAEARTC